ncbi:hypothetical protein HFN89_05615 [Rhizobium laguerreae]|nr:hypothetical protein [Rhizobium laguerreae]
MEIEKYRIFPSTTDLTERSMADHMALMTGPGGSWREFRTSEVVPAVTFAAHFFLNAIQKLLSETMIGRLKSGEIDIILPSGWRARSLDIGRVWKRHIEFTNPADPERGFILQGQLELVEKERPTEETGLEMAGRMIGSLKEQTRLIDENLTSPDYSPEESTTLDEISVYRFGARKGWEGETREWVTKSLAEGKYAPRVLEYWPQSWMPRDPSRPQARQDRKMIQFSTVGGSITPGEVMTFLPVLSEFAAAIDEAEFNFALNAHRQEAVYYTLEGEILSLLAATRAALQEKEFPGGKFIAMIQELWKQTAAADVAAFLNQIDEATDQLLELGHTSSKEEYDCNDGRTRVYATTEGKTRTTYVEWEDLATVFVIGHDRVVVASGDYETGAVGAPIMDFTLEDGAVKKISQVVPYDDIAAGLLRRSLVDLSSVHCHLVSDPAETKRNAPKV